MYVFECERWRERRALADGSLLAAPFSEGVRPHERRPGPVFTRASFLRWFAAGASRCLSAKSRIRRRTGSRRRDSRGLELKCVPQRAGNGCARGPAVEMRDTGNLSTRRAAAALRNAVEPRGTGAPIEPPKGTQLPSTIFWNVRNEVRAVIANRPTVLRGESAPESGAWAFSCRSVNTR